MSYDHADEDEVLSCVMTSLAVAPLLDIASDMDIQDLLSSMRHLLMQFYEDAVSREAIQVPLLTFNRIDPTVIPLKTLTITFTDLWNNPDINRVKLLDKFFEILPTFESFRENSAYVYEVIDFLAMLLNFMITELNRFKLDDDVKDLKLHNYLLNMFYITLEQDWDILADKQWNVKFLSLERQILYLIGAHSQTTLPDSEKTLKRLIKTVVKQYPKIDFNILLELGKNYRIVWSKEGRNDMIRSLLFYPDMHKESILEDILVQDIIPLSDQICTLLVPRAVFYWLICHTKYPYIGIHMDKLIPPTFQLLSSWVDDNKILAIKCISHIIDNAARSELTLLNYDKVMYKELTTLLDHNNSEVVSHAVSCSLKLLNITTEPPYKSAELWKPNQYDKFILRYLDVMAFSTKYEHQKIYISCLDKLITRCGVGIIKHLKSLLTLLIEFMKTPVPVNGDNAIPLDCIKCFRLLLEHAWPRIGSHSIDILMCFVNSIATAYDQENIELLKECKEFLHSLKVFCKGTLDKHLECLRSFNNKGVQEMVSFVFET